MVGMAHTSTLAIFHVALELSHHRDQPLDIARPDVGRIERMRASEALLTEEQRPEQAGHARAEHCGLRDLRAIDAFAPIHPVRDELS